MSYEGTEPEGPSDLPPVDSAPPPPFDDPGMPPPPPLRAQPGGWSVPPPAPVRRLVRDPGASLGGVASGLSQHYGIDVSVIRLAFVLFTLISGVGLLLYILAWLIIPKGEVWPPTGARAVNTPLSSRELAIGAILVGLAMVVFVSGGSVGEVLVPLLLIGGGVWLLNQSQSQSQSESRSESRSRDRQTVPSASAGNWPPPTGGQPQDTVVDAAYTQDPMAANAAAQTAYQSPGNPAGQAYGQPGAAGYGAASGVGSGAGQGTQHRKRRRPLRAIFIGLFAMMGGFIALIIVAAIAVFAFADIDFETDGMETYNPQTVGELPELVQLGTGEILLDMSALDAEDFAEADTPINLDIELDAGEVRIVIPEGITVDVDAAANLGDVDVFDKNDDGIRPRVTVADDDPDLQLHVNVGFGVVVVERP